VGSPKMITATSSDASFGNGGRGSPTGIGLFGDLGALNFTNYFAWLMVYAMGPCSHFALKIKLFR
jgi:hypothetical protein